MPTVVRRPARAVAPPAESQLATAPFRLGKRCVDVVVAMLLILLLAPLMLAAAVAVRLSSPGPVLFRQRRVGRRGREFTMLKFRSMRVDAEELLESDAELARLYLASGHKLPIACDPRVTRVGRVLRTWSVDEVPQLFNVLVGHMSIVGPRPVTRPQLGDYADRARQYLAMRPGLTGLWQVSGRSAVKFPVRADMDARYSSRCSLLLDLSIVARTPVAVLRRRGAD